MWTLSGHRGPGFARRHFELANPGTRHRPARLAPVPALLPSKHPAAASLFLNLLFFHSFHSEHLPSSRGLCFRFRLQPTNLPFVPAPRSSRARLGAVSPGQESARRSRPRGTCPGPAGQVRKLPASSLFPGSPRFAGEAERGRATSLHPLHPYCCSGQTSQKAKKSQGRNLSRTKGLCMCTD